MKRTTPRAITAGVIAGLTLLTATGLAACGDDGDPSTTAPQASEAPADTAGTIAASATTAPMLASTVPATSPATNPAGTDPAAAPATAAEAGDEVPQAIISLSPTATEMLYAVGAGDQVLAVDDFSDYPEQAAAKMQGLSGFEPNVEAIAGLNPDLVVTDGTNPDFLAQLDSVGIAHVEAPAAVTFDDIYAEIEQLGATTGHIAEAAELVGRMQTDIEAVVSTLPALETPLTYYHELDSTFFSVTSATFIGEVYKLAGLQNIADAVGDGNPYPQLSAEYILDADPDLIFQACTKYCGETAETMAARPGWSDLSAIANGNVIELDDDVASRWGPRVVEFIQQIGAAVAAAAQPVA